MDLEMDSERKRPDDAEREAEGRIGRYGSGCREKMFRETALLEDAATGERKAPEGEKEGKPSKLVFTEGELPPGAVKKKPEAGPASPEKKTEAKPGPEKKTGKKAAGKPAGKAAGRAAAAGVSTAAGYARGRVSEKTDDNVGTEALDRLTGSAEKGARTIRRTVSRGGSSRLKERPARSVPGRVSGRTEGKKTAARAWQKRRASRRYAEAVRSAERTERTVRTAASGAERAGRAAARGAAGHPVAIAVIAAVLIAILLFVSMFSSCSGVSADGLTVILSSVYLAEDEDINEAELAYTEWEADLQLTVNGIESDRPGYDEYRYQIDPIEHDPFQLMGFLTAVYGDFTFSEAEGVLREIFDAQYTLSVTEETVTRYRTETDPVTGESVETGEEYEWRMLNVSLTNNGFGEQIVLRMDADEREACELLLETKGFRQYVENVFGTDWLPYVTAYYGWRVSATGGEKEYHPGIDIGMAEGTPILAGQDGTVTFAGKNGDYGLCVVIEGETDTEHALSTRYAHCSELLVSKGQEVSAGDVIAKVGSSGITDTACLHLEVMVDGGDLNPIYFADTGDENGGTLPDGYGNSGVFRYEIPPEALTDERFAAMIAEAEKYLGYPYVWGGSSPSTSFDCSGYVSWVINHSGWSVGRLSANGLLNICTPVSRADAKPGDLVFFQGTYNTGGASHVGIYVGDGMMIHCGNPIQYASINTSYWQSHFYTFGRLP